ncbi:hypothetical protein H671_5g13694 [Cricetulus griseus]|uniref:Uncharacterized protein n=1 Tax=Cricetulus griseus TaxID=10029 RepID=A0A061I6R4_CRIGR|nr:hypothetical protein H671_5g13694 [Cricetulus griseus]
MSCVVLAGETIVQDKDSCKMWIYNIKQISAWSAVSEGLSSKTLTPLLILPPSLQLDSNNSAQCLAVGICFWFHQHLDEGARMPFKGAN